MARRYMSAGHVQRIARVGLHIQSEYKGNTETAKKARAREGHKRWVLAPEFALVEAASRSMAGNPPWFLHRRTHTSQHGFDLLHALVVIITLGDELHAITIAAAIAHEAAHADRLARIRWHELDLHLRSD